MEETDSNRQKAKEQFFKTSHVINDEFTLDANHLAVIYHALHDPRQGDELPWTDVQIKQIVGYGMLGLDGQRYDRLDLKGVIGLLRNEDDELTRIVKPVAERNREGLRAWVKRVFERGLGMALKRVRVRETEEEHRVSIEEVLAGGSRGD